jgi:uncharacterized membrane protein
MSELVVLGFKTETGAKEMSEVMGRLQKQQLITLEDAAVVVRKQDGKPKVKQAVKMSDYGIDDDFIKEVSETIEPGHSALFLLVKDVTPDKVLDEITKYDATVMRTSLSNEDEAKLRSAFGAEDEA